MTPIDGHWMRTGCLLHCNWSILMNSDHATTIRRPKLARFRNAEDSQSTPTTHRSRRSSCAEQVYKHPTGPDSPPSVTRRASQAAAGPPSPTPPPCKCRAAGLHCCRAAALPSRCVGPAPAHISMAAAVTDLLSPSFSRHASGARPRCRKQALLYSPDPYSHPRPLQPPPTTRSRCIPPLYPLHRALSAPDSPRERPPLR